MRIIPARAGFTVLCAWAGVSGWDHPRSRGVYLRCWQAGSVLLGSSPLARGLPSENPRPSRGGGIIPARAGFTPASRMLAWYSPDHPRSRGVYHARTRRRTHPERIIPARAGFTDDLSEHDRAVGDHPRSRGVYAYWRFRSRPAAGSSPLARGLLPVITAIPRMMRIIPARAGFTSPSSPTSTSGSDHPRSRGVYRAVAPASVSSGGSSPLARGLQDDSFDPWNPMGIIPARAGFTMKGEQE